MEYTTIRSDSQFTYLHIFIPSTGKSPVSKYGISDSYRYNMDRPEGQLPGLTAKYGTLVGQHIVKWSGERPIEQTRP